MATYFTEGIILKHQNFREADRLLTIYTKEYGKIEVTARGSRKITSKLGGMLEPFTWVQAMIARGKQLDTIAAVEVIKNFRQLKSDVQLVGLANYISEVFDVAIHAHQRDKRVFDLLGELFGCLDKPAANTQKRWLVIWYGVWRLLMYLGFQPELHRCLVCGVPLQAEQNHFSFRKGGLVCRRCYAQLKEPAATVSPNVVKMVRLFLTKDITVATRMLVDKPTLTELRKLSTGFLHYTQERAVPVEQFLLPG